jgi:hypothetical protein
MRINENIAQAKSILNKLGISQDDKDYLKIREICNNNLGYVGILTRLRFVDNVSDMDEIQSIFDVLKSSRMDLGKLSKMSYEDILNEFWNELHGNDSSGYKLILDDGYYSYYEVSTYEGILSIGSPSWCLKTKSNWLDYDSKYEKQYVAIDSKFKGKLLTPNNSKNLFSTRYENDQNPSVRFGVSISKKGNFKMYDDNNNEIRPFGNKYSMGLREFGVLYTCLNLDNGLICPYYKGIFNTLSPVKNSNWLKVDNSSYYSKRFLGIENENIERLFIMFKTPYSSGICNIITPKGGIQMPYVFSSVENEIKISRNDGIVKLLEDKCKYFLPNKFSDYSESFLKSLNKVDENKDWISFQINGGYIIYRKNYEDDINLPRLRRKNGLLYIEDVPLFVSLGMDGIPRFKIFLSDIDIDRPYHKSDVIKNYKEIVYKIRNEDKPKNPEPIIKQEPMETQKQEPQKIKRWWDFLKKQR